MIRRIDIENGRLANAVVHGNTVYLAGQVPEDGIAGAEAQTASVLREMLLPPDFEVRGSGDQRIEYIHRAIQGGDFKGFTEVNVDFYKPIIEARKATIGG